MIIEVVIDDAMLEEPVKKAVASAVNQVVREVANKKINELQNEIGKAVEIFLAKRITDAELKKMINSNMKSIMREKIIDSLED